jgi:uncharacterized membrane protein
MKERQTDLNTMPPRFWSLTQIAIVVFTVAMVVLGVTRAIAGDFAGLVVGLLLLFFSFAALLWLRK